jgi:hypothetical protein
MPCGKVLDSDRDTVRFLVTGNLTTDFLHSGVNKSRGHGITESVTKRPVF